MTILSPRRIAATAAFALPLAVVAVTGVGPTTSHAASSRPSGSTLEATDYGALSPSGASPFTTGTGLGGLPGLGGGGLGGGLGGLGGGLGGLSSGQTNATDASAAAETGVVMIDTVLDYNAGEAAGTGLVIGSNGLVVTNHHVVQGATSIKVTMPDGTQYTANVVGYDATHDIAVLQLQGASGLSTVTASTTPATKGEQVDAIGNAEGQGVLTDAAGQVLKTAVNVKVSGDGGGTENLRRLIETSADVVPGDSGGPLLDSASGDVIGMDVAAATSNETFGASDQGFAIPIARVDAIANKIIAGTASKDVVIGDSAAIGIEVSRKSKRVVVAGVESQSAKDAGLQQGDIITAVGSTPVKNVAQLRRVIAKDKPGQVVKLTWIDTSGKTKTGNVTLIDAPIP